MCPDSISNNNIPNQPIPSDLTRRDGQAFEAEDERGEGSNGERLSHRSARMVHNEDAAQTNQPQSPEPPEPIDPSAPVDQRGYLKWFVDGVKFVARYSANFVVAWQVRPLLTEAGFHNAVTVGADRLIASLLQGQGDPTEYSPEMQALHTQVQEHIHAWLQEATKECYRYLNGEELESELDKIFSPYIARVTDEFIKAIYLSSVELAKKWVDENGELLNSWLKQAAVIGSERIDQMIWGQLSFADLLNELKPKLLKVFDQHISESLVFILRQAAGLRADSDITITSSLGQHIDEMTVGCMQFCARKGIDNSDAVLGKIQSRLLPKIIDCEKKLLLTVANWGLQHKQFLMQKLEPIIAAGVNEFANTPSEARDLFPGQSIATFPLEWLDVWKKSMSQFVTFSTKRALTSACKKIIATSDRLTELMTEKTQQVLNVSTESFKQALSGSVNRLRAATESEVAMQPGADDEPEGMLYQMVNRIALDSHQTQQVKQQIIKSSALQVIHHIEENVASVSQQFSELVDASLQTTLHRTIADHLAPLQGQLHDPDQVINSIEHYTKNVLKSSIEFALQMSLGAMAESAKQKVLTLDASTDDPANAMSMMEVVEFGTREAVDNFQNALSEYLKRWALDKFDRSMPGLQHAIVQLMYAGVKQGLVNNEAPLNVDHVVKTLDDLHRALLQAVTVWFRDPECSILIENALQPLATTIADNLASSINMAVMKTVDSPSPLTKLLITPAANSLVGGVFTTLTHSAPTFIATWFDENAENILSVTGELVHRQTAQFFPLIQQRAVQALLEKVEYDVQQVNFHALGVELLDQKPELLNPLVSVLSIENREGVMAILPQLSGFLLQNTQWLTDLGENPELTFTVPDCVIAGKAIRNIRVQLCVKDDGAVVIEELRCEAAGAEVLIEGVRLQHRFSSTPQLTKACALITPSYYEPNVAIPAILNVVTPRSTAIDFENIRIGSWAANNASIIVDSYSRYPQMMIDIRVKPPEQLHFNRAIGELENVNVECNLNEQLNGQIKADAVIPSRVFGRFLGWLLGDFEIAVNTGINAGRVSVNSIKQGLQVRDTGLLSRLANKLMQTLLNQSSFYNVGDHIECQWRLFRGENLRWWQRKLNDFVVGLLEQAIPKNIAVSRRIKEMLVSDADSGLISDIQFSNLPVVGVHIEDAQLQALLQRVEQDEDSSEAMIELVAQLVKRDAAGSEIRHQLRQINTSKMIEFLDVVLSNRTHEQYAKAAFELYSLLYQYTPEMLTPLLEKHRTPPAETSALSHFLLNYLARVPVSTAEKALLIQGVNYAVKYPDYKNERWSSDGIHFDIRKPAQSIYDQLRATQDIITQKLPQDLQSLLRNKPEFMDTLFYE